MERHSDKKWCNKSIIGENLNIGNLLLCIILSIYPFIVIPNDYGYFYFPRYVILAVISIIALPYVWRKEELILTKTNIFIVIFVILMLIAAFKAYDTSTAFLGMHGTLAYKKATGEIIYEIIATTRFSGLTTYIFCIVLYLLASINHKTNDLLKYLISACVIVSIIAIMQHFGLNIVPHESYRDKFPPYGTIGQHNFLATYTVFILPAAILDFLKSKKTYWLICSALIYSGLLVSTTRGGWLTLLITYLVIVFYCLKHKELVKPLIMLSIAFIIVTCFLFSTKNGALYKRALSIPDNISSGVNLEDDAGSNRMYIWKNTVEQLPKYWAFGIGPDNLIYAGITLGNSPVDKAHNIYLEMLITMGVFTLLTYLVFLGSILRNCIKEHKFLYFIMIFTYLVQGFFNIDVIMVMPLFWIILGLSQNKVRSQALIP